MTKKYWWILGTLGVLFLMALSFWVGLNYPKIIKVLDNNQEKIDKPAAAIDELNNTTGKSEQAQNGYDWSVFKNLKYYYLIEHPKTLTITNASEDPTEKNLDPSEAKCVKISNKYVSVTILARNAGEGSDCLGTGLGANWGDAPDETVAASGANYTAKGMKTESASVGYYEDIYMFETASGEKIQYAISVNEKHDDIMTKSMAKDLAYKIIASFNPAE